MKTAALYILFLALLPNLGLAQSQKKGSEWEVKRNVNQLDAATASLGVCHVFVQKDGEVRLNAYSPKVAGFHKGLYHHVVLDKNGKVLQSHWAPESVYDMGLTSVPSYTGPDIFRESCGKFVEKLPDDIKSRLKNYP